MFSTSVELESDSVCVCVFIFRKLWGNLQCPNIVGSAWNLVHLLVGWIPGGVFFIFSKFSFLGPRDPFWPKSLGQPTVPKYCRIIIKLGTFAVWVNPWGCFFSFFIWNEGNFWEAVRILLWLLDGVISSFKFLLQALTHSVIVWWRYGTRQW